METTEIFTKTKWNIDLAHSQIGFKVKYLKFSKLRGYFKDYNASIYTTGTDFKTVEVDLWLNPASINTGADERDSHLKSADFFDIENFKVVNFTVNTYAITNGDSSHELYGELTIKGIKRQIKLDVEFGGIIKDPYANDKAVFSVSGKINRRDWGLRWNVTSETNDVLVSEDVWIDCEVQLIKQL